MKRKKKNKYTRKDFMSTKGEEQKISLKTNSPFYTVVSAPSTAGVSNWPQQAIANYVLYLQSAPWWLRDKLSAGWVSRHQGVTVSDSGALQDSRQIPLNAAY